MTNMKTIAYSFWVGAFLYLLFAVSILLSINIGFYVSTFLSIAALAPVVLYLKKCPRTMPLKNILRSFIFVSVICGTALSIYSHIRLSSLFQQNRLIWLIYDYAIVIMFFEAIISWQIIKLSRTFSFIWWVCIITFILAFRPICQFVIAAITYYPHSATYLNLLYILHDISFALLFVAIGMFFRPTVK